MRTYLLSLVFAVYTDTRSCLGGRCLVIMLYVRQYFTITMSKRGAIRRCIILPSLIAQGYEFLVEISMLLWAAWNGWSNNAVTFFIFFCMYVRRMCQLRRSPHHVSKTLRGENKFFFVYHACADDKILYKKIASLRLRFQDVCFLEYFGVSDDWSSEWYKEI